MSGPQPETSQPAAQAGVAGTIAELLARIRPPAAPPQPERLQNHVK